jgi:hypothetical protein
MSAGGQGPLPVTSWVAVVALVCSIVGIWPAGIPMGFYARREIDRSGGRITGRGLATAAIVLGWIDLAFTVAFVVVAVNSL